MTEDEVDRLLALLREPPKQHGLTINRLNASAAVSADPSSKAAAERSQHMARGVCEVNLWTLPHTGDDARPLETHMATADQAQRLIAGGAVDQRDAP